ncbi:MAG TPA: glutamate formimidoyltransferase [Bacteroidia bacterium]|nr:glutamate formimidoyltransferase [Bacteroidia bacterium]
MNKALIECVPNFSEGQDHNIIKSITDSIESVEGIKLLNVDPGKATNRTVVTFVGSPEAVVEAAFRGIQRAAQLIDMRKHQGKHPRMGATDVCPFIPVAGIGMEETAEWSKKLARRVGEELKIPVYLYEEAQANKKRSNLSIIRSGEYEGFAEKIKRPEWQPDFGPAQLNPQAGATVIGARDFLIAYNVNLNTKSVKRANSVAFDIREAGRVKREGHPVSGKIVKDADGNEVRIPGKLKGVKAIGWYIDEYNIAQVSINITQFKETPLHKVFEECCNSANERGLRVSGSELVGLIPLSAMIEAGKYFLQKQSLSLGVSDEELIHIAIKSMGLDELYPFDPKKRIIEYVIEENKAKQLVDLSVKAFVNETASESPAPGGGSVAALLGSMGVALATMVANLSSGKKGWEEQSEYFSDIAVQGQQMKKTLLHLIDEDTNAFNKIMDAFSLPKSNDEEKQIRKKAIQDATRYAIDIPFKTMEEVLKTFNIIEPMIEKGNPNSITDAAVGSLCARAAVLGAYLNVKVNCNGYEDKTFVQQTLDEAKRLADQAIAKDETIQAQVEKALQQG